MAGIDIARKMKGMHENRDTKALDTFIVKRVPSWKGYHVNNTAWCAAIMGAWEVEAGFRGTQKLNARSYETYGTLVYNPRKKIGKLTDIKKGDIAVFERGGSSWQGHVAYVDGVEKGLIRTIGGNQSDSVSIGWYPIDRLLCVRRSS